MRGQTKKTPKNKLKGNGVADSKTRHAIKNLCKDPTLTAVYRTGVYAEQGTVQFLHFNQ